MRKTCIIISGPTAVGKTDLAIQLARSYDTEIISADSRQCYIELDIGVAKPTQEQLDTVPHHFINSHRISETVNAAVFESYALSKAHDIFQKKHVLVMVGGTGLYIKTFCQGIDEVPQVIPGMREELTSQYETNGLAWLQAQAAEEDPLWFAQGEYKNPHRLLRALEVKRSTGRSILSFQVAKKVERDFDVIHVGLQLPGPLLHDRINHRVDLMMHAGLLDEVIRLLPQQELNALNTVGYKELFSYLAGESSLEQAVELIKQHTRQYAKRQITWFKKMEGIIWAPPELGIVTAIVTRALAERSSE